MAEDYMPDDWDESRRESGPEHGEYAGIYWAAVPDKFLERYTNFPDREPSANVSIIIPEWYFEMKWELRYRMSAAQQRVLRWQAKEDERLWEEQIP